MNRHEVLINALFEVRDHESRVHGLATLISDRYVLTCAHVVKAAIQSPDDEEDKFRNKRVVLHSLKTGQDHRAIVQLYNAFRDNRLSDVAILKLVNEMSKNNMAIVPFVDSKDLLEHKVYSYGEPLGGPAGVWARGIIIGRQRTGYYQIDSDRTIVAHYDRGFSGTPVWDEKYRGIVGIISQAGRRGSALMIPTSYIVKKYPRLPLKRKIIAKLQMISKYLMVGVLLIFLTSVGFFASKHINKRPSHDSKVEQKVEIQESQKSEPESKIVGADANDPNENVQKLKDQLPDQEEIEETPMISDESNQHKNNIGTEDASIKETNTVEVTTNSQDVVDNVNSKPIASNKTADSNSEELKMPSQRIKYLTITPLNIRVLSNSRVRLVLKFKNMADNKGLVVTLFDPRANGIADYWKFFPQSDMTLVDNNGNEYSLKDSTLGVGVVEEDWLVMYPEEESIVSFEFYKFGGNSIGDSFDLSGTLQMSWRDYNNEVQFGQYGVYLASIIP